MRYIQWKWGKDWLLILAITDSLIPLCCIMYSNLALRNRTVNKLWWIDNRCYMSVIPNLSSSTEQQWWWWQWVGRGLVSYVPPRSHACAIKALCVHPLLARPGFKRATDWYWSTAHGLGTPALCKHLYSLWKGYIGIMTSHVALRSNWLQMC